MAKRIVYRGPALEYSIAGYNFKQGEPLEVRNDLADELLGRNPEGYSLEQAAAYGVNIWEAVLEGAERLGEQE